MEKANPSEEPVETETIYSGKVIEVVKDVEKLPNGKIVVREIVRHPGAVAMVPLLGDYIIMVRQFRKACDRVLLEIPAGTLRGGEEPEECARRELIEETGYAAGRLERMFHCFLAPGYSSEIVHVYLATDLSQTEQHVEEDEFIDVVKIDLATALQMIGRNEIEDAKSISGILYLKQYLNGK